MNMAPEVEALKQKRGLIATVILTGQVEAGYAACHEALRSFHDRNGFHNIEYRQFHAVLVEAGRDAALDHMLANNYDFCLQIDADATFDADSMVKILNTAFNTVPDSDAVGAYANLKGSYLPTIDTGSGRWEVHYPGEGILPVIRTGGHFLLIKPSALQKMGPRPWFRTRIAPRSLDVLAEMDNMSRQHFSNRNPFSESEEWQTLLSKARENPAAGPSSVGEDSAFGDKLTANGGRVYVDTNVVTGHISRKVITWKDLKESIQARERNLKLSVGLYE